MEHGRLRDRLPGQPPRRLRPRCHRSSCSGRRRRLSLRVPARHERRARRHRGDGRAAEFGPSVGAVRRGDRLLVRQGAGPRPGQRRAAPCRDGRRIGAWRRRGAGGRRPQREEQHAAHLQRRHAGRPAHPHAVPGRRARSGRPRPPRHCHVACLGGVDRHPYRRGGGRWHRHGRVAPRAHRARHSHSRDRRSAVRTPRRRPTAHPAHHPHGGRAALHPARPGTALRGRQRAEPHHGERTARLDRHCCRRPHLPRSSRGAGGAGPAHRRRPAIGRCASVAGADALAARPGGGARVRPRPRRSGGGGRQEPDARTGGHRGAVPTGHPAAGGGPPHARRPSADAVDRVVVGRHHRHAVAHPVGAAHRRRTPRCTHATCGGTGRPADPAVGEPHALLLLGLPAQHLHPGARGAPCRRRYRLPHDGGPDGARPLRRDRRRHGDGL